MIEDTTTTPMSGSVSISPSNNTAGFVVTIPGASDTVDFQLILTGYYCDNNTFPVNGSCESLRSLDDGPVYNTLSANSWAFYSFTVPPFNSTNINQVNVNYNASNYNVFVQKSYLPTQNWFLLPYYSDIKNGNHSQIIYTPGRFDEGDIYYVGVWNNDTQSSLTYYLNITFSGCASGLFGPNCEINQSLVNATSNPADASSVIALSANISASNPSASVFSFDFSGSDLEYAYFEITDLLPFNVTNGGEGDSLLYYVRVTVGNNDLNDNNGLAPSLYAKLNGYPSPESYDYNTTKSIANQIYLPITSLDNQWFVSVKLPANFDIWIVSNCADCDSNGNQCLCSSNNTAVDCNSLVDVNATYPYYFLFSSLPSSTEDSAGQCHCGDEDYSESFNCIQKSGLSTGWIVFIVISIVSIIVLIVIIVIAALGYHYVKKRKIQNYEEIM